mgnify:CR=1 FL=1|tara:strand:- start:915 stop:1292 length:378 start_codon:yes stop_codon:yes gene_type:complete
MKLAEIKEGKVLNTIIADSVIDGYIKCPASVGIGFNYDGENFTDNRAIPEPTKKTIYSKFSFKKLFTFEEWATIKASDDAIVLSFIEDFIIADYLDLEHEDLVFALNHLVSIKLMSQSRIDDILG